jgi:sugar phosphate isomerase/epimerase
VTPTRVRLGVAGGILPMDADAITPALAAGLASLGIEAACTHFGIAPDGSVERQVAAREILDDAGIDVVQAAGFNPNLVHPDGATRRADLARLRDGFRFAQALRASTLLTACGSHHVDFYGPHSANHSLETRGRLVASLREAALLAEDAGIPIALECHVLTTLDSPEHVRDVLELVDSPWIRVNFDPVNLVGDLPTVYRTRDLVARAASVLGPWLAGAAHVKDVGVTPARFVVHIAELPPGEGLMDFDAFFGVCAKLGDGAPLIVEHLDAAGTESAVHWLREQVDRSPVLTRAGSAGERS